MDVNIFLTADGHEWTRIVVSGIGLLERIGFICVHLCPEFSYSPICFLIIGPMTFVTGMGSFCQYWMALSNLDFSEVPESAGSPLR